MAGEVDWSDGDPHEAQRQADIAAAEAAISRVWEARDTEWQLAALAAIAKVARAQAHYTADDIWDHLDPGDEPRALGPAMRIARDIGVHEHTGEFVPSRRRHQTPIPVWRSKIHESS